MHRPDPLLGMKGLFSEMHSSFPREVSPLKKTALPKLAPLPVATE